MAENYRVVNLLGSSVFVTYLVEPVGGLYSKKYTRLAIKVPPDAGPGKEPEEIRLLQRILMVEAQRLCKIRHKNVVKCLEPDFFRDELGLLMEYVPGDPLNLFLSSFPDNRLSSLNAIGLVKQICAGLGAAHKQEIYHRDIKPTNIMIVDGRKVVIIDFGIAQDKQIGGATLLGYTEGYAPPQQIEGEGNSDARTDIYSMGAVFYEMMNGQRPFKSKSENLKGLLAAQHNHDVDPFIDNVPVELRKIILKALHPEPDQRWQTTQEMVEVLDKFVETEVNNRITKIRRLIKKGELDQENAECLAEFFDNIDVVSAKIQPLLYDTKGQLELYQARHIYEEALGKIKNDGALHYNLGLIYQAEELYKAAHEQFNLAESICEEGITKVSAGRMAELLEKVMEEFVSPPPPPPIDEAREAIKNFEYDKAEKIIKDGLKDLSNGMLWYLLSQVYSKMNKKEKTMEALQNAIDMEGDLDSGNLKVARSRLTRLRNQAAK